MSIHTNSESHDNYLEADVDPCQVPRTFSTPNVESYNLGVSAVTQGSPTDSGDRALTAAEKPISPLNLFDSGALDGRHETKLNSPRLSTTIRPRFFLGEDSDSDESPAQPSVRRKKILLKGLPPTLLVWLGIAHSYHGHHSLKGFHIVEIHRTPRLITHAIQNEYLEENIASRPRVEPLTRGRELSALSDANIWSTTSSSFHLPPQPIHPVRTLRRCLSHKELAHIFKSLLKQPKDSDRMDRLGVGAGANEEDIEAEHISASESVPSSLTPVNSSTRGLNKSSPNHHRVAFGVETSAAEHITKSKISSRTRGDKYI
ncbi:hypothetical protein BU17DRAFT_72051 [Hysterangium stoloniferum]|nr:hypothetical protein BU17DRAFT_72051 [Hysterangium stoloniferum]